MIHQKWLHTFLTLVEVGHFTQTAEKLYMTQPGVSQQIKKLEAQVGVALLNRVGKRFELTREGETLYRFGCQRRQEEEKLFGELQFDDAHKGECRIACSGAMATFLYPHLLNRQKDYSGLAVSIEAAPNYRIVEGLLGNTISLGLVTQPAPSTDLTYEALGFESLCLVLPSTYAAQAPSFEDLNALGFIDHPDGAHYADRLLSANFKGAYQGLRKIKKNGYINQLSQILIPVSEGLGFTVLPQTAIWQFEHQALLYVPTLNAPIRDELFLAMKRYRALPKRYDWFIKKIKELISVKLSDNTAL